MIDKDFFEVSNKDTGYYHYNGEATHYEVDFCTNVTYDRIFIPSRKGKQFIRDVNESKSYGEGNGAAVVFIWTNNYLIYDSNAKNLKIR